jgi:hypothetical protein
MQADLICAAALVSLVACGGRLSDDATPTPSNDAAPSNATPACATAPIVITSTDTGTADRILFDAAYVYFFDGAGIFRAPKAGGDKELMVKTPGPVASQFAIRDGVVWLDPGPTGTSVKVTTVPNGFPDYVFTAALGVDHIVASGGVIYTWQAGNPTPQIQYKTGADIVTDGDFLHEVSRLVVDGDVLAESSWTDGVRVGAVTVSSIPAWNLAMDATTVYFSSMDGRVLRVPRSGGDAVEMATVSPALHGRVGLAVDDTNLYFTTSAVMRAPKSGGTASVVAESSTEPRVTDVAIDGECVYWIAVDGSGGHIYAGPK